MKPKRLKSKASNLEAMFCYSFRAPRKLIKKIDEAREVTENRSDAIRRMLEDQVAKAMEKS